MTELCKTVWPPLDVLLDTVAPKRVGAEEKIAGRGVDAADRISRAHAMKSCVSEIGSLSNMIARELSSASGDHVRGLSDAVGRLSELLDDELRSQDCEHRASLRTSWPVQEAVDAAISRTTALAERSGITLVSVCEGGHMQGDKALLSEALVNLVIRAVKATSRGGRVLIRTQCLDGGNQEWVVSDTGIGLAHTRLALLTTRWQCDEKVGADAGFSWVCETIANVGGQVAVSSSLTLGTTVTLRLPGAV